MRRRAAFNVCAYAQAPPALTQCRCMMRLLCLVSQNTKPSLSKRRKRSPEGSRPGAIAHSNGGAQALGKALREFALARSSTCKHVRTLKRVYKLKIDFSQGLDQPKQMWEGAGGPSAANGGAA